jgi:hypothetical protein
MVGVTTALMVAGILHIIITVGITGVTPAFHLALATHGEALGILLEDIILSEAMDMTLGLGVQVVGDLEVSSTQVGTRMAIVLMDMAIVSMTLGDMATAIITEVTEIPT